MQNDKNQINELPYGFCEIDDYVDVKQNGTVSVRLGR